MSEEQQGQFIEHNQETKHTKEINKMQIELIMDWKEEIPDRTKKFNKWIELYSKSFREIIDRELDANPNFWEDFKKPEFKRELMDRIKEELYSNSEEPLKMAA